MNRDQIEATVLSVLSKVLKHDVDQQCSRENTPDWDSLKHIEVVFAVEDELGIQFPEDVIPKIDSVARIVSVAESFYAT
jgi:acyl carrier protein